MRQPGNEFRVDPYKAQGSQEIPAAVLPPTFQKDHQKWAFNTQIARQHNFCGKICVNFSGLGGIQQKEQACLESCIAKYNQAFGSFIEEKNHFLSSLSDLALRGEDKYVARDI